MNITNAVLSIKLFIQSIGLIFNFIGFYVVNLYKTSSNQCLVLMNLSVTEIVITINSMARDVWTVVVYRKYLKENFHHPRVHKKNISIKHESKTGYTIPFPALYNQVFNGIYYVAVTELVLTMMLLTIDRLLCILSPLKYKTYMTNKNISRIIILSYVLALIAALICVLSPKMEFIISLVLGGIAVFFIILASVTYYIIVRKISESKKRFSHTRAIRTRELVLFKKHYIVPAMIVITFIVFYAVPWFVDYLYIQSLPVTESTIYVKKIVPTIQNVGIISDPFIYVFLTKHYRDIIVAKFLITREVKKTEVPKKVVKTFFPKRKIYEVNIRMRSILVKQ